MSVTKKFILIVSAGVFLLLPPYSDGISVLILILYNCVCFSLLLADFLISPRQNVLDIQRLPDGKLFFKTANTVSLRVRNNYGSPICLTLKDELPDFHFTVISQDMVKKVLPYETEIFSYDICPTKRGAFLFSNIYIKYKGRLGLCRKFAKRPLPHEFKVYPNLRDLRKFRLLMTKNRVLENGKRIIDIRGEGQEFENLREYSEGDDFRQINWPVSARLRGYVVNVYEAEKNQPVFVMIDTGRPMSYLLKGYKKLDYAINAALILSDIINQKGDASGLLVFDKTVSAYLKPGKGPSHRNALMEALYHIKGGNNTSDFLSAFRELVTRQKRRSIVFVFTDFETEVELSDIVSRIRLLRRRHTPVVVLMKNDSVIKMVKSRKTDSASIYEKSAASEYLADRQKLIRALNMNGIICVETDAENFAVDSVNHYLKLRAASASSR